MGKCDFEPDAGNLGLPPGSAHEEVKHWNDLCGRENRGWSFVIREEDEGPCWIEIFALGIGVGAVVSLFDFPRHYFVARWLLKLRYPDKDADYTDGTHCNLGDCLFGVTRLDAKRAADREKERAEQRSADEARIMSVERTERGRKAEDAGGDVDALIDLLKWWDGLPEYRKDFARRIHGRDVDLLRTSDRRAREDAARTAGRAAAFAVIEELSTNRKKEEEE